MSDHSWAQHEREGWTVCTVCGLVRNYDRPESQCRGAAIVAPRSEPAVKPTCDLECATCRYQIDPTHCADVVSGERGQTDGKTELEEGPSSDELEIARLRRELTEARADISVLRADRDRIRTVSAEALTLRDRLSTIVDEAFGLQEVLDTDALLSRLEHLLTERARQHEEVRRERDAWREWADYHSSWALIDAERPPDAELRARIGELCDVVTGEEWAKSNGERAKVLAERDEALVEIARLRRELDRLGADRHDALARRRAAAQILIAEIGASGPEDVEETARRSVERIQELKSVTEDLCSSCGSSIHIGNLTEALRDLVKSVESTKTRNTIVLRDIEAARAVLGDQS